jgi:hypothetical protein
MTVGVVDALEMIQVDSFCWLPRRRVRCRVTRIAQPGGQLPAPGGSAPAMTCKVAETLARVTMIRHRMRIHTAPRSAAARGPGFLLL